MSDICNNCSDCYFLKRTDIIDCAFENRWDNFLKHGGRLEVINGEWFLKNRKCRYFIPSNAEVFNNYSLEEAKNAVKKVSSLKMSIFFMCDDQDYVEKQIKTFSRAQNIMSMSLVTKYPWRFNTKSLLALNATIIYPVNESIDELVEIDRKVQKVKPDYYMVIYSNETDFSGNELEILEKAINENCEQRLVVFGDGFTIYNYQAHRMLGGHSRELEGIKTKNLQEKILAVSENLNKDLICDWSDLNAS